MKKHSVLKAIGFVFLVYVVLSWIIPGGSFSSGTFTKGTTSPLGIGDLFLYPIAAGTYQMFVLSALVVLAVGGFYAILNKTGVLTNMVEGLSNKFRGKERLFLVLTTIFYALAAALLNLSLPMFILIPLSVSVIMTLGFDKIKAFLATFGALVVGSIACMVGYNMDGYNYVNYFLGVEIKDTILYSIVLFVLVLAVLLFFVLKGSKAVKKASKKKDEEVTIPLYTKETASKKPVAAVVVFTLLVVLILVSMFNWSCIGVTLFDEVYETITSFTIGNDYAIFANILGSISAFGYWGNYELVMIIVMASILVAWIYKLKAKDAFEAFIEGAKELLPAAALVALANILLYVTNSSSTPYFQTILNVFVSISDSFNYFAVAGFTAVGSLVYSSYPYLLYAVYDPVTSLFSSNLQIIALVMQAIYGICSLIVPTSIMLVLGLKFMDISYKEWFKNAWKLLVALLVVVTIALLIIAAII
jgi:uncharacterized ion transporter superfamily protein YfcC